MVLRETGSKYTARLWSVQGGGPIARWNSVGFNRGDSEFAEFLLNCAFSGPA